MVTGSKLILYGPQVSAHKIIDVTGANFQNTLNNLSQWYRAD